MHQEDGAFDIESDRPLWLAEIIFWGVVSAALLSGAMALFAGFWQPSPERTLHWLLGAALLLLMRHALRTVRTAMTRLMSAEATSDDLMTRQARDPLSSRPARPPWMGAP